MIQIKAIREISEPEDLRPMHLRLLDAMPTVYTLYPEEAGYKEEGCSKLAAEKINPMLKDIQKEVLAAFTFFPEGATADQIADWTSMLRDTVKARLTELKIMGLVKKTERRGKTVTGGTCSIWEIIGGK